MAAPAAIAEVTYRDTAEVRGRVRARRRRPVRADVHDRGVAGHRRVGHGEPALRHPGGVRAARWPPRSRTEYRFIVERGLLLQIDAPDLAMERHTLFADRPLARLPRLGGARHRRHQRRARGDRPRRCATARLLGQLRRPAHPRRAARRDPAAPLPRPRRRARGLDGQRPPRPRARVLRAPSAARRDGPRRGGHRHDQQLRRARGGRRRPAGPGGSMRSATPDASSPAPTAASTPRPASATWRRRWCGRSCARCAPAPTWPPPGCSDEAGSEAPCGLA